MGFSKGESKHPLQLCIIITRSVQILLSFGHRGHLQLHYSLDFVTTEEGKPRSSCLEKGIKSNPLCSVAVRIKQALSRERLWCKPIAWNLPGSSSRVSEPVVSAKRQSSFLEGGVLQSRGCAAPGQTWNAPGHAEARGAHPRDGAMGAGVPAGPLNG